MKYLKAIDRALGIHPCVYISHLDKALKLLHPLLLFESLSNNLHRKSDRDAQLLPGQKGPVLRSEQKENNKINYHMYSLGHVKSIRVEQILSIA